MTGAERKVSTDSLLAECMEVMRAKEIDYASREDVMANFKKQADRLSLNSSLTERAWAAGFFDGEGCVSLSSNSNKCGSPALNIAQVDRRPLDRFIKAIGFGRVAGPFNPKTKFKARPHFRIAIGGSNQVFRILNILWPWLGEVKKAQAVLVYQKIRRIAQTRIQRGGPPSCKLDPRILDLTPTCNSTKYQVWLTYFGKHCDSIFNAIKYHPENPATETKTEPLRTRIIDAINYLAILQNLLDEDAAKPSRFT